MPRYYFTLLDREGYAASELAYEFEDNEAAKNEALKILSEMAADGLPAAPMNMISVEVFDEHRRPVVETRLVLDVLSK
jgi:hypothetical protein